MRATSIAGIVGILTCSSTFATPTTAYSFENSRTERWREDISVARDAWLARDRSFSSSSRAQAEQRLDHLQQRVSELTDDEIVAELARIAALSNNAHTRAYLLRNRGYWKRFPIRIWKFADGWRVVAAQSAGQALLGRRLVAIDGTPIEVAQAAVRSLYSGNARWADYMATYSLTSPEALRVSGVISSDAATFVASDDLGDFSARLDPMLFSPRDRPEESWWYLSPMHPAVTGWSHVKSGAEMPVALSRTGSNYWAMRCAGDVLYFQFNRAQDDLGEPLIAFGERLVEQAREHPPRVLLIDLRFNTGGDATKAHQFFKKLTALPWVRDPGRLVVVLSPSTFSAGITHAVWLRQEAAARFVGTEPGDELDTWSEGGNVDLPNSRLRMHYADMAHRYSALPLDVPKNQVLVDWNVASLAPDVAADWNWADYVAGRDPYAEAALGSPLACPK